MPCIVGITMDPDTARRESRREYPSLYDWQVIAICPNKNLAEKRESEEGQARGCGPGKRQDGPEHATWYVYCFTYY